MLKCFLLLPIESKELGFTKPEPYIYELLADLNTTKKTATMLIDIIEEAALLLEEGCIPMCHGASFDGTKEAA
ncbi:hypothetical protein LguiB_010076 [Lonicera macranthoides]